MLRRMATNTPEPRVAAWTRRTDPVLTVLAVVFVVTYAWPILDEDMPSALRRLLGVTGTVVWILFAVDLAVRLALARRRLDYLRSHLVDVALVVLPVLRPLRALRVLPVLNVLTRRAAGSRARVLTHVVLAVALLTFVSSVAVLEAERDSPDANIVTFGDAVWWSITTMTTVGYGDRFPVTLEGRIVASALMLLGIALLGVVTAAVAAFFVQRLEGVEAAERRTEASIEELAAEVRALREVIQAAERR